MKRVRMFAVLTAVLSVVFLTMGLAGAMAQDKPAPALTEVQQLRLVVYSLQTQLAQVQAEADSCRAALAPLRAQANADALKQIGAELKSQLEAANPGYTWDGAQGRFVPKPAEPKK